MSRLMPTIEEVSDERIAQMRKSSAAARNRMPPPIVLQAQYNREPTTPLPPVVRGESPFDNTELPPGGMVGEMGGRTITNDPILYQQLQQSGKKVEFIPPEKPRPEYNDMDKLIEFTKFLDSKNLSPERKKELLKHFIAIDLEERKASGKSQTEKVKTKGREKIEKLKNRPAIEAIVDRIKEAKKAGGIDQNEAIAIQEMLKEGEYPYELQETTQPAEKRSLFGFDNLLPDKAASTSYKLTPKGGMPAPQAPVAPQAPQTPLTREQAIEELRRRGRIK